MSWNFLISFGVGLAVYLFVVAVIAIVKRIKGKHKDNEPKE